MKNIFKIVFLLLSASVLAQTGPATTFNGNVFFKFLPPSSTNTTAITVDPTTKLAMSTEIAKAYIKSNESLAGATRKGDVLYGILDQYTGEDITLYKVTGTPTVDNIIIFQLGSEYFRRVVIDSYNVKWFGAVGDGTTDDRLKIMAAMAYMNPVTGGTIDLSNGAFLTSDRLDTTAPHTRFVGKGAKIIYKRNKVGIVLMHDFCTVDGISFEGEDLTATSAVNAGLFIQGASYSKVMNCKFKFNGHGVCVFSGNSWKGEVYSENSPTGNIIDGNTFQSKGVFPSIDNFAGVLMGFAVEKPVIGNKVTNNYIDGNFVVDHGIALIGAGYDNIIENNTINNVRSYGALLYQTEFLSDYSVHDNIITNNRINGVGNAGTLKGMGIYTQKGHRTNISNNIVTNAEIGAGVEGTLAQAGISIDGGTYNVVSGNIVNDIQANKPAIRVNNSFLTEVVGNNFENAGVGISITESNDVNVSGNIGKTTASSSLLITGGLTQSTLSPPYNSIPSGLNINISGNSFNNTSAGSNVIDITGVSSYYVENINIHDNNLSISGNGMNLNLMRKGIISNNIISSNSANGKNGILLNTTDNIMVSDNKIFSNSGTYNYGIYSDGTNIKVITNDISNATVPVFNSGSNFTITDTSLSYNKNVNFTGNLSVNNITTTGEIDGSFFSVTTPGSLNADFIAKGPQIRLYTSDGPIFKGIIDSGFTYFQIGAVTGKSRLTAANGTSMQSLNIDSDKTILSGTIKISAPTYADDAAAGSGGLATGDVYRTTTGELRIKL